MRTLVMLLSMMALCMGAEAQIEIPREPARPAAPKPAAPTAPAEARASVSVTWQGSGTVIIRIDDRELTLGANESERAMLRTGKALKLVVETPAKNHYATEFIKIDPSGGELRVSTSGDEARFTYESGSQKRQREDAERQAAAARAEAERQVAAARAEAERQAAAARAEAERKSQEALRQLDADMVFVQGGTFTMGCTAEQGSECDGDEKPSHSVTLSSFSIGRYEVTQAQWQAVMGSNPSGFSGCDDCPVEMVSWNDIQEFLRKLNSLTGKQFRLPTEAEWEYAARGGNKSRGYKYSGSNDIGSVAWYEDNSGSKTHPVGQKQPNELGLYDMSGNVWEWCSDWYGDYSSSPQSNPRGPSSGSRRVLRGGGWTLIASDCRVAYRIHNPPDYRYFNLGFRLVLSQ